MSKTEVIEKKQTNWLGLWHHPEYNGFSSAAIDLSALRDFKGLVRLYVRKNKFYEKGSNKPNYCFCLKDANSPTFTSIGVVEDGTKTQYMEDGVYYDEEGNRLYTHEEVQYCINRAAEDGRRGYGYGDNLVSDYI